MNKRVYFLSDLHLGAQHDPATRITERKVVAFLDSIKENASAVFLLGDILDYWFEYRYVVPKGFVRFFAKLAELTDAGVRVVWMIGNHDIWMRDYLTSELGIEIIDGFITERIGNHTFFLTHGDGVGRMKPSFRFLRRLFRNRLCQWLFSGIHPRWTVPFAFAWSARSRKHGCPGGGVELPLLSALRDFSIDYHNKHPEIDFFIYGHLHLLVRESIAPHCEMIVLGEWIRTFSYAVYDGNSISLLSYES